MKPFTSLYVKLPTKETEDYKDNLNYNLTGMNYSCYFKNNYFKCNYKVFKYKTELEYC